MPRQAVQPLTESKQTAQDDNPVDTTLARSIEALQAGLGSRIVAIYRFGTRFGRTPQGPSVRILLLVERIDKALLDEVGPVARRARSGGVALRLDSVDTLLRGADTFPVFALELKDTAELLHGRDVLADVTVDAGRLRLRLEQSLRTQHRDLVRAYLEHGGEPRQLSMDLRRAAHRLIYLFEATLLVAGVELPEPKTPKSLIGALCRQLVTPADEACWEQVRALAAYELVLQPEALSELFAEVLRALQALVDVVDRMESVSDA